MPGSIDPPGQAQAPIIMNQESLKYLGSVIAESVTKSQDVVKPTNFKGGNRSGGEERGIDADGDTIMANSMQSKKLSWTERKFLKQNNACYTCYRSKKVEDVKEDDLQEFGLENLDITVDNRKQVDYCLGNKFTVDKGIKESELCLLDVSTKMDPEEDELVRDIIDQVRNNPEDIRE
ncbi:hypothetical protein V4U94_004129 [Candida albicans]